MSEFLKKINFFLNKTNEILEESGRNIDSINKNLSLKLELNEFFKDIEIEISAEKSIIKSILGTSQIKLDEHEYRSSSAEHDLAYQSASEYINKIAKELLGYDPDSNEKNISYSPSRLYIPQNIPEHLSDLAQDKLKLLIKERKNEISDTLTPIYRNNKLKKLFIEEMKNRNGHDFLKEFELN